MAGQLASSTALVSFEASTGHLWIRTPTHTTVLLAWPTMRAYRCARGGSDWRGCRPEFVLPANPQLVSAGCELVPASPGLAEVAQPNERAFLVSVGRFCELIPKSVRRAVGRFPEHQWDLLTWTARTGPAAEDLLESNPTLAFAVATGEEFLTVLEPAQYRETQFLLAYRKQQVILARLGFQPTERFRKIMRKIQPQAVTIGRLKQLRHHCHDSDITDLLTPLRTIGEGIMALIEKDALWRVSRAELRRIEESDADRLNQPPLNDYYVTRIWTSDEVNVASPVGSQPAPIAVCHPSQPPIEPNSFETHRSAAHLGSSHLLRQRTLELRPPAGSDVIVPLTTPAMLIEEGKLQQNCVADYASDMLKRKIAIYRVLEPQRCTLSLKRNGSRWEIDQLKAAKNRQPSAKTVRAVYEWLWLKTATVH